MRILWSSNAPWVASGYGVQSRYLLPRLAALPEIGGAQNVAILAWFGMQGGVMEWGPFRVYPGGADSYGNDVIGAHCRDFQAERVITLIDVWVLDQTAQAVAPAKWSPWFPIDSDPVPAKVLAALEGADPPIVYSRWAQEMLSGLGTPSVYVPHGIEPSIFKFEPDAGLRAQWREALVGPGCTHLTVMNCANKGYPDRKFIQGQLRAWAAFAEGVPGARLYLHTGVSTDYGGIDVAALVKELGIAERVRYPDWYAYWLGMPAEYLACVYNAGDVFLGASMAEGFGIPIVEAQACFPADTEVVAEDVVRGMARPYTGDLITIETDMGSFDVTPEHPIWCSDGWHYAFQIDAGCQLLYNSDYAKQRIQEVHFGRIADVVESVQGNATEGRGKTHGEELFLHALATASNGRHKAHWAGEHVTLLGSGADGIGLPGGIDRWGGDRIDSKIPRQMEANRAHCEHVKGSNRLAGIEDHVALRPGGDATGETQPSDQLHVQYYWAGPPSSVRISSSVHGDQASATTVGHRVLPFAQSAEQRRPTYPAPDGDHFRGSSAQYQTVQSVRRRGVTNLPVYNLATRSGVYYAAGFLVHNCGLPVIVTDFSSMPELVRWGKAVPARDKVWTQLNSWQAWPDVDAITSALRTMYQVQQSNDGEWPVGLRAEVSANIHAEFGWDAVVRDYWAPLVRSWAAAETLV